MHIIHQVVIESAQQPSQAAPKIPTLTEQSSSSELSPADHLGIQYVTSFPFAPDAQVAGYLIKANIGPTSYGFLYGADMPGLGVFGKWSVTVSSLAASKRAWPERKPRPIRMGQSKERTKGC